MCDGAARPIQMAGRASTLTRSLIQALRRLISSVLLSISTFVVGCLRSLSILGGVTLGQFPQELIWRNKEWVLLDNAPNDDHGVGAHNVNYDVPAKPGEVVRAYDRVFILRQNIVQPRLVLEEIVNSGLVSESPFHVGNHPSQREALLAAALDHFLA